MSDATISAAGKVALVTGGARGLGAAIAAGLAAIGARVAITDIDAAALDASPSTVFKRQADVADPDQCSRVVAEVEATLGSLDILVNNAALGMGVIRDAHFTEPVRLGDIEPEQWRQFFDVNCMGPFLMIRAATPAMVGRGWGRVINVTTSMFTMLNPGFAPYGPAKAALEAASAGWAGELDGTGVTVNVLVPGGPADTRMVPASAPFGRAQLIPVTAMVPPAQWLAATASDGVTGRRFVAALWDASLPLEQAIATAGAPAGWPQLTGNVVWPGR